MSPLNLVVDFRATAPIYTQIVEQIQKQVMSGNLKPGDQLPTVRQLAAELRVNFNTVARAYRILDESGLISTQQGRGTYIWEPPSPADSEQNRQRILQELAQHYLEEAVSLGYSMGEILTAIEIEIRKLEPDK
jgi:GntR family transcriptional regulator